MSAEVTWCLSDKGEQSILDVASDVSVNMKCMVCDCKRELGEAIQALAGKKIDFHHCDGKPVALVMIKFYETSGRFTSKISISSKDCPKEYRSYVRAVSYLLYGWAEHYGVL